MFLFWHLFWPWRNLHALLIWSLWKNSFFLLEIPNFFTVVSEANPVVSITLQKSEVKRWAHMIETFIITIRTMDEKFLGGGTTTGKKWKNKFQAETPTIHDVLTLSVTRVPRMRLGERDGGREDIRTESSSKSISPLWLEAQNSSQLISQISCQVAVAAIPETNGLIMENISPSKFDSEWFFESTYILACIKWNLMAVPLREKKWFKIWVQYHIDKEVFRSREA